MEIDMNDSKAETSGFSVEATRKTKKGHFELDTSIEHLEPDENAEAQTSKSIFRRLQNLIPLFYYMIITLIAIGELSLTKVPSIDNFSTLQRVLSDVVSVSCNTRYINDMKLINIGETCPPGMELASLGNWKGSQAGCYDTQEKRVLNGPCDAINARFKPFKGVPATDFHIWKNESFCISHIRSIGRLETGACPTGYHPCSIGAMRDDCFLNRYPCPIKSARIISKIPSHPDSHITYLKINENNYIEYTRDGQTTALTGFSTSINSEPCLDSAQSHERVDDNGQLQLYLKENTCGIYGVDIDSHVFDRDTEQKFYQENGLEFPSEIKTALDTQTVLLLTRFQKATNRDTKCDVCHKDYILRFLENEYVSPYETIYCTFSICGVVLAIFMMVKLVMGLKLYLKIEEDQSEGNCSAWYSNSIVVASSLIFFLFVGILALLSYFSLLEVVADLNQSNGCFMNKLINRALEDFNHGYIQCLIRRNFNNLMLILFAIVMTVLFILFEFFTLGMRINDIATKFSNDPDDTVTAQD